MTFQTHRKIISRTIAKACFRLNKGSLRPGLRILAYHSVGAAFPHHSPYISLPCSLFERQMQVLSSLAQDERISLVSLTDALSPHNSVASASERNGAGPSTLPLRVAVTFDDGFKNNLYAAAPVLLRLHIPFTVFVTSSYIQSGDDAYLTPQELKELAGLPGVTIGAHGATHRRLTQCDDATLQQELTSSKCYIEDVIGQPVTTMSYPKGATDRRVRDAAHRAGYSLAGCSRWDINQPDRDPLLLCRSEILAEDDDESFMQKLSGAWDWYRWRFKDPVTA